MQNGQFSLSFFLLVSVACVEGGTLSLTDSSDLFAVAGGTHSTMATVISDNFTTHTLFEIYHANVLSSEERRLVRMENYNDTAATVEFGYSVEVTEVNGTVKTINFTITSLSFQDDGRIKFYLISTSGEANQTEFRDITVVVIPDTVKIQFGNRDAVDSNSTSAIGVNSGNVTIYCIVEESNPNITDISLTRNGDALALASGPDSVLISPGERKFSNKVSAIVEVPSNINETQSLTCTAVDYLGDSHVVQLLYQLSSAREGQTPVWGLVLFMAISSLWYTML